MLGLPHAGAPDVQALPSVRPGWRAALRWGPPGPPRKACPCQGPTPPQPPLLPPQPRGMLGGLLGSLPPQLHKHLGLAITLAALQQLQDWVPCEERCLGVRFWERGSAWVVRGTALPILQPNVETRRAAPAKLTGHDSLPGKPGDTLTAPGTRHWDRLTRVQRKRPRWVATVH